MPDGKLLAMIAQQTGKGPYGAGYSRALARYNPDGTLDASFAGSGSIILPAQANQPAGAVAVQDDGRIVVADTVTQNFQTYDQHGFVDTSFGDGGVSKLEGFARANALAQQADGKWIAGGALAPATAADGPYDQPLTLTRFVPGSIPVVEFHRADIDHYFITSNPLEISALDRGVHVAGRAPARRSRCSAARMLPR